MFTEEDKLELERRQAATTKRDADIDEFLKIWTGV